MEAESRVTRDLKTDDHIRTNCNKNYREGGWDVISLIQMRQVSL